MDFVGVSLAFAYKPNMPLLSEFVETACAQNYNHFTPVGVGSKLSGKIFCALPNWLIGILIKPAP